MLKDLILKNRSTRKYDQSFIVSRKTLKDLVDLARLSASAGNRQPLKYLLSCTQKRNATVYSYIGLGGQPKEGERPSAYIIILKDNGLEPYGGSQVDHGIAAQSILLGATEKGLGGCMIGMINRKGMQAALKIQERYEILLVLAIGKPREQFVIETFESGSENLRGWWDEQGVRHVPKRKLEDIIIG
jgi:nitroreductase